ncbi:MAG: YraN family protein [Nitrospirota bacterium]
MRVLGSKGEDLAVKFLRKKGYLIIERNYKTNLGEIDIIAREGSTFIFVEVKTRSNDSYGFPFEAVGSKKRHKMRNLALNYMRRRGSEFPVRFDVISIFCANGRREIVHIKDAFEV